MALIPPFFLDAVVCIGIAQPDETTWIGTGFVVGRLCTDENGEESYHTFLVTNKHVLQGKQNVVLRFDSIQNVPAIDYPVELIKDDCPIWKGHQSANIDVAAFFINPDILRKDDAKFTFFRIDKDVMNIEDLQNEEVSEGDGIFVLGFPMGIVAPQKKHVIARMGGIARIRDVFESDQTSFLIDANIFPGNSGGPVVIRPELSFIQGTKAINRAALIGIVKSYLPFKDVAISQQTGNARVIFEENSGLALVETVDSIKETVELCYEELEKSF